MAVAHWASVGTIRISVGVLLVFSCLQVSARGQKETLASLDPDKAIHQYVHEVWQTAQGLPAYGINDIVQTSDGYLWLGTFGGVVRFDGVVFEVFNRENTPELVNSYISSLHAGPGGTLWIGSRGSGLLRYEKGRMTRLSSADGLPDDGVVLTDCVTGLDLAAKLLEPDDSAVVDETAVSDNPAIDADRPEKE